MVRFGGEEKILFIQIIMIYSEAIAFVFMIPFLGFGVASIIICAMIGITLFSIYTYKLYLYKKLREEIGAMRYLTGWLINRSGDWRYIDVGVKNEEEIDISDQDLEEYEKETTFQETLKDFQEKNAEFKQLVNMVDYRDSFADKDLMKEYTEYGLITSRQIYAFEILKTILDGSDVFKTVIAELIKMKKDPIGKKTVYLETLMKKYNATDKMAYNSTMYGKKLIKLKDVEYVYKDPSDIKKAILKDGIPLILSIISSIIAIILLNFIRNTIYNDVVDDQLIKSNNEISVMVIYLISFLPIIIGFIYSIIRIKRISNECSEPYQINFNNILTKRNAFESYCEIRKRIKEYASDARIWKVYPFQEYRKIWNSEYVIFILPASYEDSFSFKEGSIGHRGYSVDVNTAPVLMLDIGSLFSTIPIYLIIACDYHFKRFTKIFYNYNLLQSWKEKIYLHLISTLQTKLNLLEPEKHTLSIRANTWKEFALTQSQLYTADRYTQNQELIKNQRTRVSNGVNEQDDEEDDEPQKVNPNRKKNIILITFAILVVLMIIVTLIWVSQKMVVPTK